MMFLDVLSDEYKTICVSLIAGIFMYLWMSKKSSKFPPGPVGLPLVGYIPFITKNRTQTFCKLSQKYGPVFSITLGRKKCVVINKYDALVEAFVKKADAFSGRMQNRVFQLFISESSLIGVDFGPKWKAYRKFAVNVLKGFGMGKKSMEGKITEEVQYFCDLLGSKNAEAFNVTSEISNAVSNIICSISIGRRFDYGDEKFKRLMFLLNRRFGTKLDAEMTNIMQLEIKLRYLPVFRDVLKRTLEQYSSTFEMLNDLVKEHRETFHESDIRDVIDAYLLETKTNKEHFTDEGATVFIQGLFIAGTETTSTVLRWCFLYIARNQKFQERLYQEIFSVFGESGIPSMERQAETPLTCSFIQEIHRHRTIVRTPGHRTTEDTELMGYKIPKNTPILPNLYGIHHDPDTFEDPDVFNPKRFLNEEGKFIKHPQVIPFSIGSRYCVASKLAEMEIYMFLTGIVQKFKILPDNDVCDLPLFDESVTGLIGAPLPYEARFIKR